MSSKIYDFVRANCTAFSAIVRAWTGKVSMSVVCRFGAYAEGGICSHPVQAVLINNRMGTLQLGGCPTNARSVIVVLAQWQEEVGSHLIGPLHTC